MRIVALVQARMSSSRLPGKVMMRINGIPMIELLLSRLSKSTLIDQIVLATSNDTSNFPLSSFVKELGFSVFEGSENDVLERFYHAASLFAADAVVRITGDCPLVDPELVDELIREFIRRNDVDYMSNTLTPSFPDGLDIEIFTFQALKYAAENSISAYDKEHVTQFIIKSSLFRKENLSYDSDYATERWTVDQLEDFQVIENVFNYFLPERVFSWLEILKLRNEQPNLFNLNQKILRNEGSMLGKLKEIVLRNVRDFSESDKYRAQIHSLIPGGAHTYSKGDDQFPKLSPAAIDYGNGSHVWDIDGNEYLDCSMGLTSVSLGHAYKPVLDAVKQELDRGVNFQRPSVLERKMAEKFLNLVPGHTMMKFAKNGSIVTTAAVKLARAKTGRNLVAFPGDHPFYSYDDWFIGKTTCNKGIPSVFSDLSVTFKSCDISSLRELFNKYPGQIACVITEPERSVCGRDCACGRNVEEYLREAIELSHANGALFIIDEMITGFKTGFPGSSSKYNLFPDMITWGKGIANGFSFCALTGTKDVMELGGITRIGEEKLFLISTTHGGETHGMAAAIATIDEFKKHKVIDHIHSSGTKLIAFCGELLRKHNMNKYIQVVPCEWMPTFIFKNKKEEVSAGMRTLFMQEMIKRGVLFQGIFIPCFSHTDEDIGYFARAFEESFELYKKALSDGYENYLVGEPAKPVFRKVI